MKDLSNKASPYHCLYYMVRDIAVWIPETASVIQCYIIILKYTYTVNYHYIRTIQNGPLFQHTWYHTPHELPIDS